jgi:hypothetical protein
METAGEDSEVVLPGSVVGEVSVQALAWGGSQRILEEAFGCPGYPWLRAGSAFITVER